MINCLSPVRLGLLAAFLLVLQTAWQPRPIAAAGPEESPLTLKRLTFVGNNIVSTKDLKNQLTMTLPSIWPWKKLPIFKKADLQRDMVRLKDYYRNQGFFHSRITPQIQKSGPGQVTVMVQIKEGPWVKVTQINLQVTPSEPPAELQQLAEERPLKIGDRLISGKYDNLKRLYLNYLLNHGHAHAVVEGKVYVNEKLNTAKIDLQVTPGVFSHFGKITVTGNTETPGYLILRKLAFKPGDVFNYSEIYKSQRNLYKLDLFSSVDIVPEKVPPQNGTIPVAIKLEEKKKRAVKFGLGYGSEDKIRVLGALRLRNLGGGGRTLDLEGKYSFLDSHFTATFSNPQIWASYFDLIGAGGGLYLQYPSYNDFEIFGQARLERQLPWKLRGLFGYLIQQDRPSAIAPSTQAAFSQPQEQNFLTSQVFAGVAQDTTDSKLYPTRGGILSARGEASLDFLGADLQYLRTVLEVRRFQDLWKKKLILAGRVKLGLMGPIETTPEIPIFRRFFCGGYTSMRGYRLDYLGPRDTAGLPIGGDALLEGSGELRFPIYKALYGVIFLDFGNVYPKISNLDVGQLKYAAGAGLMYQTPVGPIAIDVGVPLNPIDPRSDGVQINFSIGQAF